MKRNKDFKTLEPSSYVKHFHIKLLTFLIIGIYFVASNFLIGIVPTSSMKNTIMPSSIIICEKSPKTACKRGEIIVLRVKHQKKSFLAVKRIIGLEGDEVKLKKGKLYINNKIVKEPYVKIKSKENIKFKKVPQNHYIVMGDNRKDSQDSRNSKNPFVPKSAIIGKVLYILNK